MSSASTTQPISAPAKKIELWRAIVPVAVAAILALLPAPTGLAPTAWLYFAVFAGVVVALILEPIPAAAVGLIGVGLAGAFGLVAPKAADSIKWVLAGFSNTTVWLIFAAFMFALGYEKTALGKRIALALVKLLGSKTLGLGYAIAFADLVLAPFMPSNTARSAGTLFPVIRNIPALYGSEPGPSARKIGSYLMWTALAATCVTSSMFITSLAPTPLALSLVKTGVNVEVTWMQYCLGFLPVGIVLLLAVPLLTYLLYPPEIKISREVPAWAGQELSKLGRFTLKEGIMAALVVLALALWIFGASILDATMVAVIVIGLMLITQIVNWDDILAHKAAWNILVWFATLVTLADGLNKVGFVTWFAKGVAGLLGGISPIVVMLILTAVFFVVHYMFASLTAHTTAVLPVLLAAGAAIPGVPVVAFSLLLCYSLGLMGIITPYATGPSPVYYGSGYIGRRDFWLLGLVFGAIFLVALLGIGTPYLLAIKL